jgi:small-conductance mechanosensitive channel
MNFFEYVNIDILEKTFRIVFTLILGVILSQIFAKSIGLFFDNISKRSPRIVYRSRIQTLKTISVGVMNAVLSMIILLLVASDLGFNIVPILTGASIAGVALSFGAQKLIQDLIAGFFLIIDNTINIGDSVKIGESKGTVDAILMRRVVLRDSKNNLIHIPASEIKGIIVYNQF